MIHECSFFLFCFCCYFNSPCFSHFLPHIFIKNGARPFPCVKQKQFTDGAWTWKHTLPLDFYVGLRLKKIACTEHSWYEWVCCHPFPTRIIPLRGVSSSKESFLISSLLPLSVRVDKARAAEEPIWNHYLSLDVVLWEYVTARELQISQD